MTLGFGWKWRGDERDCGGLISCWATWMVGGSGGAGVIFVQIAMVVGQG